MGRTIIYPRAVVRERAVHAALAGQARTFDWLAEHTKLSRSTVFGIAQGKGTPLTTATKIAAALGLQVEKLFRVIDRDPKQARPHQEQLALEQPKAQL